MKSPSVARGLGALTRAASLPPEVEAPPAAPEKEPPQGWWAVLVALLLGRAQ